MARMLTLCLTLAGCNSPKDIPHVLWNRVFVNGVCVIDCNATVSVQSEQGLAK